MTFSRRTKRGYGWVADLPDIRDYAFAPRRATRVPRHVDLRVSAAMPNVWNQGNYGSCTAHAVGAALAFAHNKANIAANGEAFERMLSGFMPSRFFIYRGERVIDGDVAQDNGAQIRDGMKVISKQGAPDEKLYPYDAKHFNLAPSKSVLANAAKHKATKYQRIDNRTCTGTLAALATGSPVAFGFTVYTSFESDAVAASGVVPMPLPDEQVLGGHAVLAVGYDARAKYLIVRNSWGSAWGDKGYFTMPFDYAFNPSLADDFWTVAVAT